MSGLMGGGNRAPVLEEIDGVFRRCDTRGFLYASEVGRTDNWVELDGDEPVAVASVIKVLIAVAFARAVSAGTIDPRERATVPSRYRLGGSGTAGCLDPVEVSLRDLALFMMSMSDNAATDLILHRVGPAALEAVMDDLGLTSTVLRHDMEGGALAVAAELGLPHAHDLDAQLARISSVDGAAVRGLAWIDPPRANASTPRQIGTLLEAVWTDRAGTPDACALVRELMSHQVSSHRLASGFPDDITVTAKTGTLPTVRNEAGVVTFGDGRRFTTAVFTRSTSLADRQPEVDTAIGRAAFLAVTHLRDR